MSNEPSVAANTNERISPPLEVPSPSPRVPIDDPEFDKLTSAEKLNDSNYRELVYQSYPNEPTCACVPVIVCADEQLSKSEFEMVKSPGNLLVCRSGCKRSCCSSVRQSGVASSHRYNANKDDKVAPFTSSHCIGNQRDNIRNVRMRNGEGNKSTDNSDYCCAVDRLRGGGEGGEQRGENGMYPKSVQLSGTMIRWLDDAWKSRKHSLVEKRLEGGGGSTRDFEYVERHPVNLGQASGTRTLCVNERTLNGGYRRDTNGHQGTKYSADHQDSNRNKRSIPLVTKNLCADDSYDLVAPGCCCPGRETLKRARRQRANDDTCIRKPCPGIDCLVKAFHETQEFVESLGKVPGLAGLGLMDPSDSPYFGRAKTDELESKSSKATTEFASPIALPNPQCTGPCNAQMFKSIHDKVGSPVAYGPAPYTIAVPGRGGIIREAVPTMPTGHGLTFATGKTRKKEDRVKEAEPTTLSGIDVEPSPCGEPRCRARRKNGVPEELPPVADADETTARKVVTVGATSASRMSRMSHKLKGIGKMRTDRRSSLATGASGDRNGRKRSSGRASRRLISFVYSAGDAYSGSTCGHKNCIEERHRVPRNMGWLWNLNETVGRLKPRPGWRPGAIGRHVSEILREAKANFMREHSLRPKSSRSSSSRSRSRSAPSRGKRSKPLGDRGSAKKVSAKRKDEDKDDIEPPPTLHIHRKDGTYYVTMYPIKQETMDLPKLEIPMKPLQFKIAKNKDDASVASSSTASDMEIEFSPPAAVNRYRKMANVVHVDTQVKQQEIIDAFKGEDAAKPKEKKKGKAKSKK